MAVERRKPARKKMLTRFFCILLATLSVLLSVSCSQEKNTPLKVGDQGPEFSLQDLDGEVFTLSQHKGVPVVMRFFLTDCKFCKADTPIFNEFHTSYGATELAMIYIDSLSVGSMALEAFRKEHGIRFPIADDPGGSVSKEYKVKALPQTVILDPQHKIIAAVLGGISREELQNILAPYLP